MQSFVVVALLAIEAFVVFVNVSESLGLQLVLGKTKQLQL